MANGGDTADTSIRTATSQAVVEAVATAEGIPPAELCPPEYEPLHDVIDPEALDALFAPRSHGGPRPGGTVTFTYCGYDVTVETDGTVRLE
ncbi:hypothetical protein EL22_26405 [Halostagnicola sp. A56]|uniref:HalOD1 output domain-containing protein n=1 Tax=Halostagnicola sp. A56 TaxID=1495067 RepID=UPI00065F6B72|nr:HalOD1 output domain-containing protein [Halostagnicola sp. A56]KMT45861.1 hypothetical protein EL22_26405 [Halostagnicola sp. A56]